MSPAGYWQTGCVWWGAAQPRFHVDLKLNFALKTNSMAFLPATITWGINVLYESLMKWTWHHSKLAVEEVSFLCRLRVVLLQLLIYRRWSSRCCGLGCHAPMTSTNVDLSPLDSMAFTWEQFPRKYSWYQSIRFVWKLNLPGTTELMWNPSGMTPTFLLHFVENPPGSCLQIVIHIFVQTLIYEGKISVLEYDRRSI